MGVPGRSIAGSTALVTGAGSGMGRATAQLFAQDGANVVVTDVNEAAAHAVAEGIAQAGGSALALHLDVTDQQEIAEVVRQAVERFGGIDILVNNAGYGGFLAIDEDGYDQLWDAMLAVHMTAQQRLVRAVLPFLRKSSAPRIVNIASTEALGATRLDSAYSAAKGGVVSLTRALAVDLGREGITVNCICPGPIETALTSSIPAEAKTIFAKRRTALGRYGAPEEVAHMTLSLCLPGASYLTGAIIPVDGGLSARFI